MKPKTPLHQLSPRVHLERAHGYFELQMFKEAEKGNKEVNIERTEEAIGVKPDIIATGCPFCNTMMTDGVKHFEKEQSIEVKDVAELIAEVEEII